MPTHLAADLARFSGDTRLARALLARVNRLVDRPVNLMEVCGTHTMAISSLGVRRSVDPRLRLLSGPGCPVCVTDQQDIDAALILACQPGVTIATFGDMVRVPGSASSLEQEMTRGADVQVVYSPLDALKFAQTQPSRTVVFLGVGFETTIPTVAASVQLAAASGVANFLVLPLFKTMPMALRAIASTPQIKVDGFILPGHVSTIIGSRPYEFLAQEFHKPCCIVGFELLDILQGLEMLVERVLTQSADSGNQTTDEHGLTRLNPNEDRSGATAIHIAHSAILIQYRRVVPPEGNPAARRVIDEVFQPADATWRGLGLIPQSGLEFRPDYRRFDARERYDLRTPPSKSARGCRCGDVLLGVITPPECKLFARVCTTENPLGPCMVSSEGACAAYYKYER